MNFIKKGMLNDGTIYFIEQRADCLVYLFLRDGEEGRYMLSSLQASASKLDVKSPKFMEQLLPHVVWRKRDPQPARVR